MLLLLMWMTHGKMTNLLWMACENQRQDAQHSGRACCELKKFNSLAFIDLQKKTKVPKSAV